MLPRMPELLAGRAQAGETARMLPAPKLLALLTAGTRSFTAFPGKLTRAARSRGTCASWDVCDVRIDSLAEAGEPSRPMPTPSLKVPKHWHDGHLSGQLLVDMGAGCRPRAVLPVSPACLVAVPRVTCQQSVLRMKLRRPVTASNF